MLKASQVRTNRAAFSDASMSRQPGQVHRLVGDHADRRALDPAEPDADVGREQGMDLQELPVVEDAGDDGVGVVRLVRRVGDEAVERGVGLGDLQEAGLGGGQRRRVVQVVGRQVGQQLASEFQAVVLVLGLVVGDPGLDVVRVRAAEVLEGDLLPGHRLDDVRPGDEHVRGSLDHEREVGDRWRVDRAARARPHDQGDLRDHAGGDHVAVEDLAEQPECDHSLLDPRAPAVVDADQRAPGLERVIHQLDDLLPVHLAQRSAEHGEVLAVHAHRPAVDGAETGDHAIAVGAVGLHPEVVRPVPGQLVELGEGARVEQPVDPLARGHLALGMLAFHGPRRAGVNGLVPALLQDGDLAGGGVRIRYGWFAGNLTAHAPQGSRRPDHSWRGRSCRGGDR